MVRLFDCRQQDQSCLRWKIKGEVERVLWDSFSPFNFFVCIFELILEKVSNSLWIQRESTFTFNVNIYNKVKTLFVLSYFKHWMYMNIIWMDSLPLLYDAIHRQNKQKPNCSITCVSDPFLGLDVISKVKVIFVVGIWWFWSYILYGF